MAHPGMREGGDTSGALVNKLHPSSSLDLNEASTRLLD